MRKPIVETKTVVQQELITPLTLDIPDPFNVKPVAEVRVARNWIARIYPQTWRETQGNGERREVLGYRIDVRHIRSGRAPSDSIGYRTDLRGFFEHPIDVKIALLNIAAALAPTEKVTRQSAED